MAAWAPGQASRPEPSLLRTSNGDTRSPVELSSTAEAARKPSQLKRLTSGFSHLRMSGARMAKDLEAALAEPLGSWDLGDIDWRFVFGAQHYGTALTTLAILVALCVIHWTLSATRRVFFVYDASISYVSPGDTIPAWVAVVVPLVCFLLSLLSYELVIFRSFNNHITNAAASIVHFLIDVCCTFITVEFVTELTKFLAGRLRPNFLQECYGAGDGADNLLKGPVLLGDNRVHSLPCISRGNARKSFPSGHSSVSCAIMTYNVVYLLWAGYLRAEGASFMGLRWRKGWRGSRRLLHEGIHGAYLLWILCQFAFVWAVGVSRFNDNKHNISDIVGGWLLGGVFALIYATRAIALHQYVVLHDMPESDSHATH